MFHISDQVVPGFLLAFIAFLFFWRKCLRGLHLCLRGLRKSVKELRLLIVELIELKITLREGAAQLIPQPQRGKGRPAAKKPRQSVK
jgi:hypothetical protein